MLSIYWSVFKGWLVLLAGYVYPGIWSRDKQATIGVTPIIARVPWLSLLNYYSVWWVSSYQKISTTTWKYKYSI